MNKYRTELIILLVGLLVGIAFTFVNVLYFLPLFILVVLVAVVSLLVIIVGLFTKSKAISIGLACFLASVLLVGSYVGMGRLIEVKRQQIAETVINDIEDYKAKKGVYPLSLKEVDAENRLTILRYTPSADKESYTVSYLMNGYHRTVYSSKTGAWTAMQ